jgi:hypothetical protein
MENEVMMNTNVHSATGDSGNAAAQPFDYAAAAAEVSQALDTIARVVPKFLAAQENSTTFVRRRRKIALPLVERAITTAEQNPPLQSLYDIEDARAVLLFQQLFRPIEGRLLAAARDLGFSLDARLMEVSRMTRQFYVVAKQVVERTPGNESLASHVEGMKAAVPQANAQRSAKQVADKAARDAERAAEKAARAEAKAAEKAARAKGTTVHPPASLPGPM